MAGKQAKSKPQGRGEGFETALFCREHDTLHQASSLMLMDLEIKSLLNCILWGQFRQTQFKQITKKGWWRPDLADT